jgi:hypothetical protein
MHVCVHIAEWFWLVRIEFMMGMIKACVRGARQDKTAKSVVAEMRAGAGRVRGFF